VAKIPLTNLEAMFHSMRTKSGWNTDGPLLWGYFFTDKAEKPLLPLAQHLADSGYRIVQLYPTDDDSCFMLHVERIERHTPGSLYQRNSELEKMAIQFGVESYDGMDVGPVGH
jgi:hypothetical protein